MLLEINGQVQLDLLNPHLFRVAVRMRVSLARSPWPGSARGHRLRLSRHRPNREKEQAEQARKTFIAAFITLALLTDDDRARWFVMLTRPDSDYQKRPPDCKFSLELERKGVHPGGVGGILHPDGCMDRRIRPGTRRDPAERNCASTLCVWLVVFNNCFPLFRQHERPSSLRPAGESRLTIAFLSTYGDYGTLTFATGDVHQELTGGMFLNST